MTGTLEGRVETLQSDNTPRKYILVLVARGPNKFIDLEGKGERANID